MSSSDWILLKYIVTLENDWVGGGVDFQSVTIDQHYMTLALPLSLDARCIRSFRHWTECASPSLDFQFR